MRSTLYIKFALVYLSFGFLSIFCVASITPELMLNRMEAQTSSALYREASLFATDYLPDYFSGELTVLDVRNQLSGMQDYMEANIWFVEQDGTMIASCSLSGQPSAPQKIANFNPAENGSDTYSISTYHDYFQEKMITVITPVTSGFTTNGYLLIHRPYASLQAECDALLRPVYITVFVIFILSLSILIAFQIFVYRPLRQITEAAQQYASGNLDYEIPVNTQDEMGYLSASLNYMSTQLRDMEDYQKKFIGNVSHDFRSPLTSIKGYLEAMADGTIPVEMQERYFKILLFETERLTDLTADLLTLNEFDTQNLLLDCTSFDIHEVIKNTASSFEGTCTQKRISIELLLNSKILNVNADKRKIQQVLYNLLDNAIKFSPNDSEITIETTERNGKVFVSVKDHGIGIPKKSISKIWDRFYKTDLSRGKDKKGTGLGLAIVKEIIQAHNENINVISTEGVGTEFIFSLKKA
ncbi:MAG: HAMP domain-containing histidine kinase [Tyzzerella sp.]|nr:HAMP domain-containing histidine kinase [Tyzzerella sp.]